MPQDQLLLCSIQTIIAKILKSISDLTVKHRYRQPNIPQNEYFSEFWTPCPGLTKTQQYGGYI